MCETVWAFAVFYLLAVFSLFSTDFCSVFIDQLTQTTYSHCCCTHGRNERQPSERHVASVWVCEWIGRRELVREREPERERGKGEGNDDKLTRICIYETKLENVRRHADSAGVNNTQGTYNAMGEWIWICAEGNARSFSCPCTAVTDDFSILLCSYATNPPCHLLLTFKSLFHIVD